MLQSERGQTEISAARVREVEAQLTGAQTSLKSERLLLQQASSAFLLSHTLMPHGCPLGLVPFILFSTGKLALHCLVVLSKTCPIFALS